jgi:FhuF 2Fe-2S C-terminal domain
LDQLTRLGPPFALITHPPQSAVAEPWQPLSDLLERPAVLQSRVAAVREALAQASGREPEAVEQRVAASMTQLGLAARLVAPALAVAILTGALVPLDPANLRWQPAPGSGFPLSVPSDAVAGMGATVADLSGTGGAVADLSSARAAAELADALGQTLVGPVDALVRACGAYSLSPQVLWGNVASALNSAASLIAAAEPSLAARTRLIATRLLDQPPLRGLSRGGAGPAFGRLSCCLIYRLTPGPARPVCGDCILRT